MKRSRLPLLAIGGLIVVSILIALGAVKITGSSHPVPSITPSPPHYPTPIISYAAAPPGTYPELYPNISWSSPEKIGPTVFYVPELTPFAKANSVISREHVTKDKLQEIKAYYDRELEKRGWKWVSFASGWDEDETTYYAKDNYYFSFQVLHEKGSQSYAIRLQYTD
jgi:hypothetical protein